MKSVCCSFLVMSLLVCGVWPSLAQTTLNPRVDDQYSREVKITRVELKGKLTVLSMRYRLSNDKLRNNQPDRPQVPFPFPQLGNGNNYWISFEPKSYLSAQGKRYRFVKAEGIPLSPEQMRVYPDEEVMFKVYFERLDRGVEKIDLYEGRNGDGNRMVYWNFYGIRIKNPAPVEEQDVPPPPVVTRKEPAPAPPPVIKKPEEQPLPPKKPVERSLIWSGLVLDAKTKKPLQAKIVLENNAKKTDSTATTDGTYRLKLLNNGSYRFTASAKGYADLQESLNLAEAEEGQLTRDLYLTPLAVGEKVALNNIYFETSKARLLEESYPALNQLANMMLDNANIEIRLEGHTDNVGDSDKNRELSIDRVMSVKRYLMNKGIAPSRIQTKGYGDAKPVTDNTTEEARQKNRRVEFVILKM